MFLQTQFEHDKHVLRHMIKIKKTFTNVFNYFNTDIDNVLMTVHIIIFGHTQLTVYGYYVPITIGLNYLLTYEI